MTLIVSTHTQTQESIVPLATSTATTTTTTTITNILSNLAADIAMQSVRILPKKPTITINKHRKKISKLKI